jgi:hypothetical protein
MENRLYALADMEMENNKLELSTQELLELIAQLKKENRELRRFKNKMDNRGRNLLQAMEYIARLLPDYTEEETLVTDGGSREGDAHCRSPFDPLARLGDSGGSFYGCRATRRQIVDGWTLKSRATSAAVFSLS